MKVRTIATIVAGLTALAASCVTPDSGSSTTEASAPADAAYAPMHGWTTSN